MWRKRESQGRYHIDPTIKANRGGPPPEGHARRCQGRARSTGQQCGRWAIIGRPYCARHGGRHQLARKTLSYYSRNASENLAEKLREIEALPDEEKNFLNGEVEVAIHLATKAWMVYDHVVVQGKLDDGEHQNEKARAKALSALNGSFERITKLQLANGKLKALAPDKVSVKNIEFATYQIMRILEEDLGHDKELLRKIQKKIETIDLLGAHETRPRVILKIE